MELTGAHAMQGLMLVATIAGGYAVVKNQLARVIQDLSMADLIARVKVTESRINSNASMHNHKHPKVD
mgnify:CR=1 FL=1